MRKFDSYIFLGNGKASEYYAWQLHRRLDEGLEHFSGLQQPSHNAPSPEEKKMRENSEDEIFDVARDIAAALGVRSEHYVNSHGGKPYDGGSIPDDWDKNEPKEPEMLELYRENRTLRKFTEAAVQTLCEIDEYLGGVEGDPDGIGKGARDALALLPDKPV